MHDDDDFEEGAPITSPLHEAMKGAVHTKDIFRVAAGGNADGPDFFAGIEAKDHLIVRTEDAKSEALALAEGAGYVLVHASEWGSTPSLGGQHGCDLYFSPTK